MNRKEASLKWCPMVRYEGNEGGSFNRGYTSANPINGDTDRTPEQFKGTEVCNCLADQCAMWEWAGVDGEGAFRRGYCGLSNVRSLA